MAAGGFRPPGDQRRDHADTQRTAVGAQVRRILVETATGSTTLRFDEAGKPLAAALPYGETPWVRITAAGTDDGSPGCSSASPICRSRNTTRRDSPTRSNCVTPCGCPDRRRIGGRGVGPGSGTAGQAGVRPRARRYALRAVDGLGPGGAGQLQPDADRADGDVGDPDGVGSAAPGPEAGRPDRRAKCHCSSW